MLKLQDKVDTYIYYLENKQYVERYGNQFAQKVINLTFQYLPSNQDVTFLVQVQKFLQSTDMSLKVGCWDIYFYLIAGSGDIKKSNNSLAKLN